MAAPIERNTSHSSGQPDPVLRPAAKKFPLELAGGMLRDILIKEFEALIDPSNVAKTEALEAAKSSLPRRLALITSQIEGSDARDAFSGSINLLTELWQLLAHHPALATALPSALESSLWMQNLSAIFETSRAVCHRAELPIAEGPRAVVAAMLGMAEHEPAKTARLISLLQWWGDDICGKRWGVTDPWGALHSAPSVAAPLNIIARKGLAAFVPLVIGKGCPVNSDFAGSSLEAAAVVALMSGHRNVVDALLDHGLDLLRPYEEDGLPLALRLFERADGHLDYFAALVKKRPEIVHARPNEKAPRQYNMLEIAMAHRDVSLVELVLAAGAPIEYSFRDVNGEVSLRPSLAAAMMTFMPKILLTIIAKGRVLEGWREKYDDDALADISSGVAQFAVCVYGTHGRLPMDPRLEAFECLDLILSSGIVRPWDSNGDNSLLKLMYLPASQGGLCRCIVSERSALQLLRRYHNAGVDILHSRSPSSPDAHLCALPEGLLSSALGAMQTSVVDWYLSDVGSPSELAEFPNTTLLGVAIACQDIASALLLLQKFKVPASYPDKPLAYQSFSSLMQALSSYSDLDSAKVLEALFQRDPSLLDAGCYTGADAAGWNPLVRLVEAAKPRTLKCLLQRNAPAIAAMANKSVNTSILTIRFNGHVISPVTPAQAAAATGAWECLDSLLRYTDARVTDILLNCGSPAAVVKGYGKQPGGPSRALVALVEARASREASDPATAAVLAVAATNAFEDPSLKLLTKKDEKKKKRKRASKQRRKRAAAANAGAGSAAPARGGDSDSSSDDDDYLSEEPDDNLVDSRNAPSLDLMLEQMGLKNDEHAAHR